MRDDKKNSLGEIGYSLCSPSLGEGEGEREGEEGGRGRSVMIM